MLSTSIKVPAPVGPGDRMRIISPGMAALNFIPVRANRAERILTDLGFTVSYGSRALLVDERGMLAGTAEERAADFVEAFADPSVDAILAADAGLGNRDLAVQPLFKELTTAPT